MARRRRFAGDYSAGTGFGAFLPRAFILGVLPLVLATGAGANARASIGITVFTGMLASTCLAVLFVPSFFVVIRAFEEWMKARGKNAPKPVPAE